MPRLGTAALVSAVLLVALAGPVVASQPATITIEATRIGPMGSFELSGAVADAGTFAVSNPIAGGPGPGTFVNVHATETFTGTNGTFTIVRTVRLTWGADPTIRTIAGTWTVISGSGAYEDLHAHGTVSGTVRGFPPAEVFELTYSGSAVND